jgi:hypothetical protein
MNNTFFALDKQHWPIAVLTIEGAPQTDEEMKQFLESWQSLYVDSMQKNERYKLIFDARNASIIYPKYLIAMAKWLRQIKLLTEKWMDRTAIIVSNPNVRLLIQFVFKYYKAVRPFKVFETKELQDAYNWVNSTEIGDHTASGEISINDLLGLDLVQGGGGIDFSSEG